MRYGRATPQHIAAVERRLELRRERLTRHWQEMQQEVARKNRWTPLVAVTGLAAVGYLAARSQPSLGPRPQSFAPMMNSQPTTARRSALAAVTAALGGCVRFATSPTGRALWTALQNRARRPR